MWAFSKIGVLFETDCLFLIGRSELLSKGALLLVRAFLKIKLLLF